MGGVKRKSMAAMEKSQGGDDQTPQGADASKGGKKTAEKKAAPVQQKQKLPFLTPKMADQDMVKSLTPLKAITVFTASRALGVNSSIANGVLRSLEGKKLLVRVGGFSGHYVWKVS
jgi:small subunit ribosomal protein S25e